ncbi:MAG TPA: response regulator transcription factor [Acidimicrobiales bacterium]|nr:response regulator transcription factor [Acidimicrobiales bacterium]
MATRVLLVDDDERLVRIVAGILEEDGIEIVASLGDGREAVRLIHSLDPDVVVLDMMLPTRPGLAVADAIRRLRPDQPIVLFSSLLDPRIERIAVAHGLVYLEKCDGIDALEDAIFRSMNRRQTISV